MCHEEVPLVCNTKQFLGHFCLSPTILKSFLYLIQTTAMPYECLLSRASHSAAVIKSILKCTSPPNKYYKGLQWQCALQSRALQAIYLNTPAVRKHPSERPQQRWCFSIKLSVRFLPHLLDHLKRPSQSISDCVTLTPNPESIPTKIFFECGPTVM
jgi:hypothetical protein